MCKVSLLNTKKEKNIMAKRITYHASFKGKVALAALKESRTLSDLAQEFRIHPAQITKWKTKAVQGLSQLFEDGRKKTSTPEVDIEALYAQIGKLQSQLEFLKKKTGMDNS
jgi:transposase